MKKITQLTAEFDAWIEDNYASMKKRISYESFFDEDTFHDTYLAVLDGLESQATGSVNFEVYFINTYRRLRRVEAAESFKTINPSEIFFQFLVDKPQEDEATPSISRRDILCYCNSSLAPDELKLFNLRFIKGLTAQQTGDYIGCSASFVSRQVNRLKAKINSYFTPPPTRI